MEPAVVVSLFPAIPDFDLLSRGTSVTVVFAPEELLASVAYLEAAAVLVPAGQLAQERVAALRRAAPSGALLLLVTESPEQAAAEPDLGLYDGVLDADRLELDLEQLLAERRDALAQITLAY